MDDGILAAYRSENAPHEIGDVERETGLPKDTLRIWERRYGFPRPVRSAVGRREYTESDVVKLRLLKRLIDQGYRPKAIASQPMDALRALPTTGPAKAGETLGPSQFRVPTELLKDRNVEELSRYILSASEKLDVRSFVLDCVRPLCQQIGQAWAEARLSVCCEHIIIDRLQSILRRTIATARYSSSRPKVLLTTPPGEKHGLGLLMVQALLSCDGVECVSLGTETPVDEIANGADLVGAGIVGLSISSSFGKKAAANFLSALRARLPLNVDLWAGGAGVTGISPPIVGVNFLPDLEHVPMMVGRPSNTDELLETRPGAL